MKFSVKYEKSNIMLMTSIFILLLITSLLFLVFKEYLYFIIYLIITLLISYVYFGTSYFVKEKYFVTKLGFIKIKIKYSNISNVIIEKDRVIIYLNKFSFSIYPSNKEIFLAKINSKLTNKNSCNIIKK